jgi:hypothetical protein
LENVKAFPALAAILSVVTALLTACSAAPASTAVSSATPGGAASGSRAPGSPVRVFGRIFDNPGVTVTGGRLYVTWQVNPAASAVPRFELTRVDQLTGAIKAAHLLSPGRVEAPLADGGWLWVPVATSAGESLLRLNPVDLAATGDLRVGGGPDQNVGRGAHLAAAGGALWVAAGDRLLRVSLISGQVIAMIPLPGAHTSGVAANGKGTVLVVSEADDGGIGSVQRRNPVTGALLVSHPMSGVAAPELAGVIDSGVWLSEPTGLLGYVERFRTAGMAPDPATDVSGTNAIGAAVADGVAWITDYTGGARRNYCANPVTGLRLATIPLPDLDQDSLLAVSVRYLYYDSPASSGFYLRRVPVPAACSGLSTGRAAGSPAAHNDVPTISTGLSTGGR